jgi:hypothetical protein
VAGLFRAVHVGSSSVLSARRLGPSWVMIAVRCEHFANNLTTLSLQFCEPLSLRRAPFLGIGATLGDSSIRRLMSFYASPVVVEHGDHRIDHDVNQVWPPCLEYRGKCRFKLVRFRHAHARTAHPRGQPHEIQPR